MAPGRDTTWAFSTCKNLLLQSVRWPNDRKDYKDYDGPDDPENLIAELRRKAVARHRHHVANIHRNYGRVWDSSRSGGTNRLRYAPTDTLKALILANVSQRMEYKEFLLRIYSRYGLVFGDREAEQVLEAEEYDRKAFRGNAERLEQRLGSLGMLRRLSDACAYVQNPFARRAP